ncbi:MAG: MFS transporter [Ethanoligenens sp.]
MNEIQNASSRKRWLRIIPIAFITYSLAYIDRSNFGSAVAGGMGDSLHITTAVTSMLSALFFFGYFFFQIPGAIYAQKRSAKKLVFISLIVWGVLASATGIVNNVRYLYVIRFLLGIVESAVMPAMLIFLSNWFTKSERSKANSFLILGNPVTIMWMSIVSGYLLEHVGWKNMFIIEGIPPIIWAFIWLAVIQDKPSQAKWLTHSEKQELEGILQEEQKDIVPVKNYAAAFKKPKVIALAMQYFFWSIGVYGFVMWLPSIIKNGSKFGITSTGWLSALPYLFATVMMLVTSYFSDKTMKRKVFIWVPLLIGAVCFYLSYQFGATNFWLSYALLCVAGGVMYAPYGSFFAFITELLPKNVAGVATALINGMGALGSFVGAYFVGYLNGATGSPSASFFFMAASLVVSVVLMCVVRKNSEKKQQNPVLVGVHTVK